MKKSKLIVITILTMILACSLFAQRITVSNAQFMLEGKKIWINGVNTPWDK